MLKKERDEWLTNEQSGENDGGNTKSGYVRPRIITYSSDEILEQVGPALTCSPSPCPPG